MENLPHERTNKENSVKEVIAAMAVGKDVSSLFPNVVNCIATNNIEKKLVFIFNELRKNSTRISFSVSQCL